MNKSYETIITLLNSFIFNKAFSIDENVSWKEIYYYSKIHNIAGIIGHVINTFYDNCETLNDRTRLRFKDQAIKDFGKMSLRFDQGAFVSHELSKNNIDHVVLKGYVLRNYYPVKELRVFGDVDFLIHTEDRTKSDEIMKKLGFEQTHNWEPSYAYKKSISCIEIHTDLFDTDISANFRVKQFFNNNIYHNTNLVHDHCYEFNKETHITFLIAHIAKHCSTSGAGIKMFLDLALLIHNEHDIDWGTIEINLHQMGMWHFSSFVFRLLKELFLIDIPVSIDNIEKDEFDIFVNYIFEAGSFGQYKRDIGAVQLVNDNSSKMSAIIHSFFPTAKTIEKRYTYLSKYPYLLPVAWIHRAVLNSKKLKSFFRKNQKVLTADTSETKRLKNIRTMIGL